MFDRTTNLPLSDLIFDAERRWALRNGPTSGPNFLSDLIFDAERRWAQVIYQPVYGVVCQVIWSLMPKGVEHNAENKKTEKLLGDLIFDAERRWAPSDHYLPNIHAICDLIFDAERRWALYSKDFGWIAYPCVIWSLMPKGVEHMEMLEQGAGEGRCDLIFDAERRWALS